MNMDTVLNFFLAEAATAPKRAKKRYLFRGFVYSIAFAGLFFTSILSQPSATSGSLTLRATILSQSGVTAILGLIALAGLFYELAKLISSLDELQRAIHIKAMLVGCASVASLTTAWGVLAVSLPLPGFEPILALPVVLFGYYSTLLINRRRYS
jgi:hypothetical protein